jgi:hypothetical protein
MGHGASIAMEAVPPRWRGLLSGMLQEGDAVGYLFAAALISSYSRASNGVPSFLSAAFPRYSRSTSAPRCQDRRSHRAPAAPENSRRGVRRRARLRYYRSRRWRRPFVDRGRAPSAGRWDKDPGCHARQIQPGHQHDQVDEQLSRTVKDVRLINN